MKVLIACGGSAGHIFPGLALAEELKEEDSNSQVVIVVSSRHRDKEYLRAAAHFKDINLETVCTSALPYRMSFKHFFFIVSLLCALLKSFYIILKYRPQVVIGFGGYTSFAPLIVAWALSIPTLIHEQNYTPGRANQFLAHFVDRVAVSFDGTDRFFRWRGFKHKIVKTGFPLRKQILNGKRKLGEAPNAAAKKFTILVIGGSLGAHNLNELVLNCLSRLDKESCAQIHMIHLAGKRDVDYVRARYATMGVSFQVFDFLGDMAGAYRCADLLVGRCGAGTIFEAASFGLPCLFIPHSYGTRHQKANAGYFKQQGAALVLDEKAQTCEDFARMFSELIKNKSMRENLSQRIRLFENPRATSNLRDEVNDLYKQHHVHK